MGRNDADRAVQGLHAGNVRYAGGWPTQPHQTRERRLEIASVQRPFAAILGCSDSRVPPEIVFDQGLGDLFVVRTAGHVVDHIVLASLEYAVEHLGHLVETIRPAVEKAEDDPAYVLDRAVRENVVRVVAELEASTPVLAHLVQGETLSIVGAVYTLETGRVEFLR
ncbi:MAG: carbonic anhydrase [Candidatus Bipolaricaulota bacterium]|nr:carbonic anhydrase [Candidatus Bipolaricaulota bacterium]